MIQSIKVSGFSLFLLASCGAAWAQEEVFSLEPMKVNASWEFGQIESFDNLGNENMATVRDKQLISRSAVWMLQEARLTENSRAYLGVGGMYFFVPTSPSNSFSFGQRAAFGLTAAYGEFDFLPQENGDHYLQIKTGIFPYKYNPDAKNLGEYMFRTYTYPTIIYTGGVILLNSAGVQLNGVSANTKVGGLTNDLMLTIKTDQVPTSSLSLTDIVSYSFGNYFTVGAGFMFDNFYDATNLAKGTYDNQRRGYYYEMKNGTVIHGLANYDTTGMSDSISKIGHYTFVGQKAMVRASLDLGNVISSFAPNPYLGNGQLRFYFEAVVMGLKDYPGFYEKVEDRIAYMFGANLPTFGVLDVLSLEMEYCSNPYANNITNPRLALAATPFTELGSGTSDDVKWTVYARKSLSRGVSVSAQAARDHLRLFDFYGRYNEQSIMQNPRNWYWAMQLNYAI